MFTNWNPDTVDVFSQLTQDFITQRDFSIKTKESRALEIREACWRLRTPEDREHETLLLHFQRFTLVSFIKSFRMRNVSKYSSTVRKRFTEDCVTRGSQTLMCFCFTVIIDELRGSCRPCGFGTSSRASENPQRARDSLLLSVCHIMFIFISSQHESRLLFTGSQRYRSPHHIKIEWTRQSSTKKFF